MINKRFKEDELIIGTDAIVLSIEKNNINTVELGFRYSQLVECRVTRNPVMPVFLQEQNHKCCIKFYLERSVAVYSEVFLCDPSALCLYNIISIEKTLTFGCTKDVGDVMLTDDEFMSTFDHENEICKGYVCKQNDEESKDFVPIWLQKTKQTDDAELSDLSDDDQVADANVEKDLANMSEKDLQKIAKAKGVTVDQLKEQQKQQQKSQSKGSSPKQEQGKNKEDPKISEKIKEKGSNNENSPDRSSESSSSSDSSQSSDSSSQSSSSSSQSSQSSSSQSQSGDQGSGGQLDYSDDENKNSSGSGKFNYGDSDDEEGNQGKGANFNYGDDDEKNGKNREGGDGEGGDGEEGDGEGGDGEGGDGDNGLKEDPDGVKCYKKVVFTNFWDVLKNHKSDNKITFHIKHNDNKITLEESKEEAPAEEEMNKSKQMRKMRMHKKQPKLEPVKLFHTHNVPKGSNIDEKIFGSPDEFKSYDGLDSAVGSNNEDDDFQKKKKGCSKDHDCGDNQHCDKKSKQCVDNQTKPAKKKEQLTIEEQAIKDGNAVLLDDIKRGLNETESESEDDEIPDIPDDRCKSNEDCPDGAQCNLKSGQCEIFCKKDTDCGMTQICNQDGICEEKYSEEADMQQEALQEGNQENQSQKKDKNGVVKPYESTLDENKDKDPFDDQENENEDDQGSDNESDNSKKEDEGGQNSDGQDESQGINNENSIQGKENKKELDELGYNQLGDYTYSQSQSSDLICNKDWCYCDDLISLKYRGRPIDNEPPGEKEAIDDALDDIDDDDVSDDEQQENNDGEEDDDDGGAEPGEPMTIGEVGDFNDGKYELTEEDEKVLKQFDHSKNNHKRQY